MKKPAIHAIFVDFGNVCVTFDNQRFMDNFTRAAKVPQSAIETILFGEVDTGKGYSRYSPLFEALECGKIGPTQFFFHLTKALDCGAHIDYETFARIWVDVFHSENAELDQLLFRLPQAKYLLSNTNAIVYGRYIAGCRIVRNHFPTRPQHILSYDVGAIKPDISIYSIALKRAKVKAEEALFIDDLTANIDVWRELGGHGIVYHAGKNSIAELETELRTFGLLN